ncbi:MAG: HNH endonuclease [Proteobacteria bacterium]|nr:MAG: HNH endonuclease [Pseudomonadota bacterium]
MVAPLLKKESIVRALEEYRKNGVFFFDKYEVSKSKNVFIKYKSNFYSMKAVVFVAGFLETGEYPADFNTGEMILPLTRMKIKVVKKSELARVDLKQIEPFELSQVLDKDERERVLTSLVIRRGSEKFRSAVMKAYNNRCAFTGEKTAFVLEAAHIFPYKGAPTDHVQNGILMRSDIHSLFDQHLITINHATFEIRVSPLLRGTYYFKFSSSNFERCFSNVVSMFDHS